jgi:predicted HAD superfamily Cof-like phosphohydrolase
MIFAEADVLNFMKAAGQTDKPDKHLYEKLVDEEYRELLQAQWTKNEVETFDAILDSIWVLMGLAISMNLPVDAGWAEVTRSNYAKIDPATGTVLKNEDGKVMKPKGWTPPDLKTIITKHRKKYPNGYPTESQPGLPALSTLAGYTA